MPDTKQEPNLVELAKELSEYIDKLDRLRETYGEQVDAILSGAVEWRDTNMPYAHFMQVAVLGDAVRSIQRELKNNSQDREEPIRPPRRTLH
jgi:hypothetical protein